MDNETLTHTYENEAQRCMRCDCRPWGKHANHPCIESGKDTYCDE